jgi:hypothetical protein
MGTSVLAELDRASERWSNDAVQSLAARERWNRQVVAELTNGQIESLSNRELIDLIRASDHPWENYEMERHLRFADRSSLIRLAFVSRWCCQNAEAVLHEVVAMDDLDGPLNRRTAGTLFGDPR